MKTKEKKNQETTIQETTVQETTVQETTVQETTVQETTVQESLYDVAIRQTSPISSALENAVEKHIGGTAIVANHDDNGQEYISAKFTLSNPTKTRSEIVVNDISLATSIERMRKDIALGEVAIFALCKELSNFADSDASSLGFDSTTELANALFGFGKSTTANYRRVGKYFVKDDLTLVDGIPGETSISLLNQLLSYVNKENGDISNIKVLFRYGIINPYMKQKTYKEILSILSDLGDDSFKQLKDMTAEEIEELKKRIKALQESNSNKKGKKTKDEEKKTEETKDEESATEEPRTPQTIIGQNLNMVHELEMSLEELPLTDEEKAKAVNALEELYILFNAKVNEE